MKIRSLIFLILASTTGAVVSEEISDCGKIKEVEIKFGATFQNELPKYRLYGFTGKYFGEEASIGYKCNEKHQIIRQSITIDKPNKDLAQITYKKILKLFKDIKGKPNFTSSNEEQKKFLDLSKGITGVQETAMWEDNGSSLQITMSWRNLRKTWQVSVSLVSENGIKLAASNNAINSTR